MINQSRVLVLVMLLALSASVAYARVYRWVDENGNVQFSDKPPSSDAKGLTELDQRGMVRKTPEKIASAGEVAQKEAEKQAQILQKRRDQSLLQSFSLPEEIDYLRDRQIDAVNARVQTNKLRQQAGEEKLKRLTAQADNLAKAKKSVPDAVKADIEATRKELDALAVDTQKITQEIDAIKARAEADKKRLLELRSLSSASVPAKK